MTPQAQRLLRRLEKAVHNTNTSPCDCPCPTWRGWADILAAASLTAGNTPNGNLIGGVLAALAAVAKRHAESRTDPVD